MAFFGLFGKDKKEKLDQGLEKTKTSLFDKISKALVGKTSVDDEFLDELEEILISSDFCNEEWVVISPPSFLAFISEIHLSTQPCDISSE